MLVGPHYRGQTLVARGRRSVGSTGLPRIRIRISTCGPFLRHPNPRSGCAPPAKFLRISTIRWLFLRIPDGMGGGPSVRVYTPVTAGRRVGAAPRFPTAALRPYATGRVSKVRNPANIPTRHPLTPPALQSGRYGEEYLPIQRNPRRDGARSFAVDLACWRAGGARGFPRVRRG